MSFLSGPAVTHLLETYGYALIAAVILLEATGLPLPGESLLIAAALYAGTTGHLDINLVVAVAAAAAILGDNLGYAIGRFVGEPALLRWGGRIGLTEQRLAIARNLFRRHGGKVVLFGRFVVLLRTVAALMAGVTRMPWPHFLLANATGGILWCALYGYAAYFLGDRLEQAKGWATVAIGAVAVLAFAGTLWFTRRQERRLAREAGIEPGG
ncbi:DedA family protein [Roseomonas sp. NAR14]|uniref:DedA family protein n=1 Tax=Roseomonas acroporae TaxID=2937791 RepID=A0A9X1Y9R5_9PROT|nr:DedA family protein [Roseomonas acroporae]MCK8785468.1 DedA family protein [Roseomonas acroporae]